MLHNEISLPGCSPEPLSNYLKALGVLRCLAEGDRVHPAKDPNAKGYWQDNTFTLVTNLSAEALEKFFLYEYRPTPLISPWNGSTGFYAKDKQKALLQDFVNASDRFADYSETIRIAQAQVDRLGLTVQPKDKGQKKQLITALRNRLPDRAITWLDSCVLITGSGDPKFPPLTGTGGNDGNFEFSRTFMQQLQVLFDLKTGSPHPDAAPLLKVALSSAILPMLPFSGKIGQFNPIAAGGANAAPGYEAESRVNPWDFVLMLEGILLFTAGATRRYGLTNKEGFAYPFTVSPSNAGYGSASEQDTSRGELWAPLWQRPATLGELKVLFGEGRAKVNHKVNYGVKGRKIRYRTAQTGVDFARAVATLGVKRGLSKFVRYGFQERNGLSYFAIPLGHYDTPKYPKRDPLRDLDLWLNVFSRIAQSSDTPTSIKVVHRHLETSIIEHSQGKVGLLEVLITLGDVEKALNRSLRFTLDKGLRPIPPLTTSRWIRDCYDQSPEFRLALSLATGAVPQQLLTNSQADENGEIVYQLGGLRSRLSRVRGTSDGFWQEQEDNITLWQEGSLEKNLIALVRRIDIETEQRKKLEALTAGHDLEDEDEESGLDKSSVTHPTPLALMASLQDIIEWLMQPDAVRDRRIEAIARGLSLVRPSKRTVTTHKTELMIPVPYALLKLVHHRILPVPAMQSLGQGEGWTEDRTMPRVAELVSKLAAGNLATPFNAATRRLRGSGVQLAIADQAAIWTNPKQFAMRLAAALAFPITNQDAAILLKQIAKNLLPEDK